MHDFPFFFFFFPFTSGMMNDEERREQRQHDEQQYDERGEGVDSTFVPVGDGAREYLDRRHFNAARDRRRGNPGVQVCREGGT